MKLISAFRLEIVLLGQKRENFYSSFMTVSRVSKIDNTVCNSLGSITEKYNQNFGLFQIETFNYQAKCQEKSQRYVFTSNSYSSKSYFLRYSHVTVIQCIYQKWFRPKPLATYVVEDFSLWQVCMLGTLSLYFYCMESIGTRVNSSNIESL